MILGAALKPSMHCFQHQVKSSAMQPTMTLHIAVHPYILMDDTNLSINKILHVITDISRIHWHWRLKDSSALGNLTERSGSHEKGRSAETALAATADEDIYSRYSREGEFKGEYVGEDNKLNVDTTGILQDLDQFPYDFNLYTAHDLDSLENGFLLQLLLISSHVSWASLPHRTRPQLIRSPLLY